MIDALYEGVAKHEYFVFGDVAFAAIFFLELSIRLVAGPTFPIGGPDRWWNIFDTFVVLFSWLECFTELCEIYNDMDLGFMRTLRLIRVIRILRSANDVPGMHSTQVLLQALSSCIDSFFSALVLLMGVISVFAMSFMQATLQRLQTGDANDESLRNCMNTSAQLLNLVGHSWR